jgi:replicative DNA helicase
MNAYSEDFGIQRRQLFSREAEQAVLGALLLDGRAVDAVSDVGLQPVHFADAGHRVVFQAVLDMAERGVPVDVITVVETLESRMQLDAARGPEYLVWVVDNVPSVDNVAGYARVVVDLAYERLFFQAAQSIQSALLDDGFSDHDARMAQIQQVLAATERADRDSGVMPLSGALRAVVDAVELRAQMQGISGVLTGFQHVDYRLNGMGGGELVVVAGRPGMGKTAYFLNVLRHLAMVQGRNALVFSLEMPTAQLAQRMVAAQGKVKLGLLKSGKVLELEEQTARFGAAVTALHQQAGGRLFFNDQAGLNISQLVAIARRQHRQAPLSLVVVDHIGLVESTLKTDVETLRIGQITRALKKLAKDLGCTVMALSQVNRECEKRGNKRPMISDLRMSGSIEQDADVIQLLYRDEYYNENTQTPGQIEVNSAKVRDGEPGVDYLSWMGSYNRMEGIEPPAAGAGYQSSGDRGLV